MTTLTEFRDALVARSEIVDVSQPFAPDASDAKRQEIGAAVKRRLIVYKTLQTGEIREEAIDVGVLDLGGAGETVITEGAGPAKEQPDPATVWRDQCEAWLTTNATDPTKGDASIVEWALIAADEVRKTARVNVVLNSAGANKGPFFSKVYFAALVGSTVLFGPLD